MSPRRVLALLGVVALFALLTLLSLGAQSGEPVPHSVRSAGDDGRLMLFRLLERLGFEPRQWERPPSELPAGGTLWAAHVPRAFDPEVPADDPLERARAGGPHAWSHYADFVRAGGVLILPGSERSARFCEQVLGLPAIEPPELGEPGPPPLELELEPGPGWLAVRTRAGNQVALRAELDGGAVLLVGADPWLDNAGLPEGQRALLAVRLLEGYGGGAPILFDEHALGGGRLGASATSLAFGAGGLVTWHLLALLVLAAWAGAWAREFPRDPRQDEALAPLLRARATAALLVRGGRVDTLARMLRAGVLGRLGGRAFADGRAEAGELAALARRRGEPERAEDWVELLAARPVRTLEELVELDRDLRALEERDTSRRRASGRRSRRQE